LNANITVIYSDSGADLQEVAEAFGEAAEHLSSQVRMRRIPEGEQSDRGVGHPQATLDDLEWADGIAFGTPAEAGRPAPALMSFIEHTEPLWSSARLFDKVISVFTDQPEGFAPDPVVHPIYEALYHWGAVIVGPRAFELAFDARPRPQDPETTGRLSGPRLRTAHYRGRRLAAIAGVLAAERARRERLEL
jgi:NAD(P)H dehydrogenase (quinone)